MEFMPDFGADWRKKFRSDLADLGLIFLDPTNKPIETVDEVQLLADIKIARETENYELLASGRDVRHIDLRMCDMASFVVANLDLDTPTCGTWEEIFDSNRSKKPVLVRCFRENGMLQGGYSGPCLTSIFSRPGKKFTHT
jgi:hypothetical protein